MMARFAAKLLETLPSVLQMLECTLGPETSSLAIRVGLHSGPVTVRPVGWRWLVRCYHTTVVVASNSRVFCCRFEKAGVLRGDKGRFQLFGDTVNTGEYSQVVKCESSLQILKLTTYACC